MTTVQQVALSAIRAYQHFVSPHKGFLCAYAVHTGRCGCSELGYRAIQRYGLTKGWRVLRLRMAMCGLAYRRHKGTRPRPPARERGDCDCDLPCDLDLPTPNGRCDWTDAFDCCDVGGCDWGSNKDKKPKNRRTHLPPFSERRSRAAQARQQAGG